MEFSGRAALVCDEKAEAFVLAWLHLEQRRLAFESAQEGIANTSGDDDTYDDDDDDDEADDDGGEFKEAVDDNFSNFE